MAEPEAADNLLAFPGVSTASEADLARRAAAQVRTQLSLLHGYVDLMEGLSPRQNIHILKVMGEKIRDLTAVLNPFLEEDREDPPRLADYRKALNRNRELMTEYRILLRQLRQGLQAARAGAAALPHDR